MGRQLAVVLPRRDVAPDAVGLLTLYTFLLLAIPSRLTVSPLGTVGTPAALVSLACLAAWLWWLLSRSEPRTMVIRPLRRALFILAGAMFASFTAGAMRPMSGDEVNASQIMMLLFLGWCGVALALGDLVPSRERLDVFIGRLALGTGLFAAFGVLQFVTGATYTEYIQIPGLSLNSPLISVESRNGLVRPASTALHPIEFGVTLAVLLPICIHVASFHTHRTAFRRWFPVVAVAIALPISISRSAIIGALVAILVLLPSWPPRKRAIVSGLAAASSVVVFTLLPGVIGTLRDLFTGISEDSSAQSRTDSYGLALHFIDQSPWFGRGFGSFLPKYRILDNQYLVLTIEAGVIGLVAMLGVFVTSMVVSRLIRAASRDEATRDLSQTLLAAVACSATGYAFFDGFSFPVFTGVLFILLGLTSSLWRLQEDAPRWERWPAMRQRHPRQLTAEDRPTPQAAPARPGVADID